MSRKVTSVIATIVLVLSSSSTHAGIVVTESSDAGALSSALVGSGVTVSSPVFTGSAGQAGSFTGGLSAGVGIDAGIMLSSGNVADAVGPNASPGTTTDFFGPGSAILDPIATGITGDAAVLAFDISSAGGDLFFKYAFASEEYSEFVNAGVNDVFGFFLDGTNLALVPGTSDPVSVDTVNAGTNAEFFNDNDFGVGTLDLEYDGITDVFTASILGLSPGIHRLELAIADVGDRVLDSTVFIEAGSLTDTDPGEVPEPTSGLVWSVLAVVGLMPKRRYRAA